MRQAIDEKVRQQVMALYQQDKTGEEIMALTGIKSRSSLYKIINQYGLKNRKTDDSDTYSTVINLPKKLEGWCMAQENLGEAIARLIEKEIAYSGIEGTSQNCENLVATIGNDADAKDILPYSEIEGSLKKWEVTITDINDQEIESMTMTADEELIRKLVSAKLTKYDEKLINAFVKLEGWNGGMDGKNCFVVVKQMME